MASDAASPAEPQQQWGPDARRLELLGAVEDSLLAICCAAGDEKPAIPAISTPASRLCGELLRLWVRGRRGQRARRRLTCLVALLDSLHGLLVTGRHATPRELYYSHVTLFQRQQQSDDLLKWLCRVFQVPRHHLRLHGTAKGLVRGHLRILEPSSNGSAAGIWVDGMDALESRGHSIIPICAHMVRIESMARVVLIVEKETVFHRLLDEGLLDRHKPCIIVTARGFPDLPTRYFLRRLNEDCAAPRMLILTDFDPSGLAIAATYAFGPEQAWMHDDLTLPHVQTLICPGGAQGAERFGLRRGDVAPLTVRDRALARGLEGRLRKGSQGITLDSKDSPAGASFLVAIDQLLNDGVKYELDSLERLSDLVDCAIRRDGGL